MSSLVNTTSRQVQPFVIIRVDFQENVIVSEHPVEVGVDITDHAQVRPSRIIVDAIVPETPFPEQVTPGGVPAAVQWLKDALGQPLELIVDNEGVFPNLFIETAVHPLTVIRERRFTLRLKRVDAIVAAVDVIVPATTTNPGATTTVNAGQQAPQTTQVPSSFAFRTLENLGGVARGGLELARAFGFGF